MFKFLKEKLKNAISHFSKKVGEEVGEKAKKEAKAEKPKKIEKKKQPKAEKPKAPVAKAEPKKAVPEKEEKKKGFFGAITEALTTKALSEQKFEDLFWELEISLMENNVAVSVIEKIKDDLKNEIVDKKLKRNQLNTIVIDTLKSSIKAMLSENVDFLKKVKQKKPFVICFFGINGSGKTTTIAKLAHMLKKKKVSCVLAAADTFRAAAIDQLEKHANAIGVKIIKQDYGSDAAAVAFDAIQHAKANSIDVVLIDTAGRSHSNVNLMDELKKIVRVANPDLKIFVGDSITGNDMVEQAEQYDKAVGIDGIILAKADVDEKGGAVISAAYVTKKPILFLGIGQSYDDIEEFNPNKVMHSLGL